MDFFFTFAWGFGIDKWRGLFGEFSGLRFPRTKHEKSSKLLGEIRSKIRDDNSKNSGNLCFAGQMAFYCEEDNVKATGKKLPIIQRKILGRN